MIGEVREPRFSARRLRQNSRAGHTNMCGAGDCLPCATTASVADAGLLIADIRDAERTSHAHLYFQIRDEEQFARFRG